MDKYVIAYIDDILIYSPLYQDHVLHVRMVLTRLLRHQLYVKAKKCEFHQETITFLGYMISWRGVEMDTCKVKAVMDWPKSTKVKDLQRFLGFANFYQCFIQNYSIIAIPS